MIFRFDYMIFYMEIKLEVKPITGLASFFGAELLSRITYLPFS